MYVLCVLCGDKLLLCKPYLVIRARIASSRRLANFAATLASP